MDQLPEWTPGPGQYTLPTDFVKAKEEERLIPVEDDLEAEPLVVMEPTEYQKGFKFGTGGRDDLKRKDPGYPGAGKYEYKTAFVKKKPIQPKKVSAQHTGNKLNYPHAYDLREVNNGIKTSFGMGVLSATTKGRHGLSTSASELGVRRSMPHHLRTQKFQVPGPGTYKAPDSVQILKRDRNSIQECTWQTQRGGFIDLPKGNPGPGTYKVEQTQQLEFDNRVKAMEPGFSFPQGPKDAMAKAVSKNQNPGPGAHDHPKENKNLSYANKTFGQGLPPKPLPDNGVPGPGAYDIELNENPPSFKIFPETQVDETRKSSKSVAIGPNHYYPRRPQEGMPGTKIGNADREEVKLTGKYEPPAPNRYNIRGDFDFRDPNNVEDKNLKVPKFAFGIKPVIKNPNQDVPGPGTYEVDQYPMNQKNIAYWIGTDVRRDLGVPYAKDFPGPGSYEHGQQMHPGAYISFPYEKKKTQIVKTNDPGPASYHIHDTVGVIPLYNRYEVHPREEGQRQKEN